MEKKLTEKQQEVFNIICTYINDNQMAPTVRDIMELTGLKSSSTVHGYLSYLKAKGYIDWEECKPRTMRVLKTDNWGKSDMVEVSCKELYRRKMTIDIIEEVYELGEAFGKKCEAVENIYDNKDIADKLKIRCMVEYNKFWGHSVSEILARIRSKAQLEDEQHVFTFDFKAKELVIVDLLIDEYKRLCQEHAYLVKVKIAS
jgi:repressor LexA